MTFTNSFQMAVNNNQAFGEINKNGIYVDFVSTYRNPGKQKLIRTALMLPKSEIHLHIQLELPIYISK